MKASPGPFACLLCGGAPDWPENGVANEEWVMNAIEWRLEKGADGCPEIAPAIDAWSLEWIANSENIVVEIETDDWPVFVAEPQLQGTLIQILALEKLNDMEHNPKKCLKALRKYAKRSGDIWDEELDEIFDKNIELYK